jgi:hypothetical protein
MMMDPIKNAGESSEPKFDKRGPWGDVAREKDVTTNGADQKYGPHTAEVEAILREARTLSLDDLYALDQHIDIAPGHQSLELKSAINAALARDTDRMIMGASFGAAGGALANAFGTNDEERNDIRLPVSCAVTNAALAVAAQDVLTEKQFRLLLEPWALWKHDRRQGGGPRKRL